VSRCYSAATELDIGLFLLTHYNPVDRLMDPICKYLVPDFRKKNLMTNLRS